MSAGKWSVVLFGGLSRYSCLTLEHLINRNFHVQAVVLHTFAPSQRPAKQFPEIPISPNSPDIVKLCKENDINILYCASDENKILNFLSHHRTHYYVVACFPRRIPQTVTGRAQRQCINIHPSVLPRYRGANPIFWQLKNAESQTGVTLHLLSDVLDAGDIFDSKLVSYDQGAPIHSIENKLISAAIDSLESLARKWPNVQSVRKQVADHATWQPSPCEDDFIIDAAQHKARDAFNFLRAYSQTKADLRVISHNLCYSVREAVRFKTGSTLTDAGGSSRVSVKFLDGTVELDVSSLQTID